MIVRDCEVVGGIDVISFFLRCEGSHGTREVRTTIFVALFLIVSPACQREVVAV